MVSRCGEIQDSESNAQVNYGAGAFDSSKDSTFLLAVDNTAVGECDVTHVQQDDRGIDHEKFSYPYQGLEERLTGVEGARPVLDLLA